MDFKVGDIIAHESWAEHFYSFKIEKIESGCWYGILLKNNILLTPEHFSIEPRFWRLINRYKNGSLNSGGNI